MAVSLSAQETTENVATVAIEYLLSLQSRLQASLETSTQPDGVMAELFTYLTEMDDKRVIEEVRNRTEFPMLCNYFTAKWMDYFERKELSQSAIMIRNPDDGNLVMSSAPHLINYEPEVEALIARHSPQPGNRDLVMVGCGAFPETLMRICQIIHAYPRVIGIDSSSEMVESAKQVSARLVKLKPGKPMEFVCDSGASYDYSNAGLAFFANGLKYKRNAVLRAAATMPQDGIIVVRNGENLGRLIYEDVFENGPLDGLELVDSVYIGLESIIYLLKKTPIVSSA